MMRTAFVPLAPTVVLVIAAWTSTLQAQNWPQFRGLQSGVADDDPPPIADGVTATGSR